MPTIHAEFSGNPTLLSRPSAPFKRCTGSQVAPEVCMMKVRLLNGLMVVSLAAALSGCVSYGNTHALVSPIGVVGYHTFKPDNANTPRDIQLPEQRTPDRIAAVKEQRD
jgi:hypothetical protein